MLAGLRTVWRAIQVVRVQGYAVIWSNVAFVVLAAPLVTLPGAFAALMHVSYAALHRPHEASLELFWEVFRARWWRALPWGLAHALFAALHFTNLAAAYATPTWWGQALAAVYLAIAMVWALVLLTTWPLYDAMTVPSLWGATRNALVLVARGPVFALVVLAAAVAVVLASLWLLAAWVLLTFGTLAVLGAVAVDDSLAVARGAEVAPGGKTPYALD